MKLNEKTMQKTIVVVALALLANLLWGSAAPVIKIGYGLLQIRTDHIPSLILFAGTRFTLAGVLAVLLGSLLGGKLLLPKKPRRRLRLKPQKKPQKPRRKNCRNSLMS